MQLCFYLLHSSSSSSSSSSVSSSSLSLKWSFLSCLSCCLCCCCETTQESKQQQAPKQLQTKQIPPQNLTTQRQTWRRKRSEYTCRWRQTCMCACVFLTGRMGVPAVWMLSCDLLKVFCFILEEPLACLPSSLSLVHSCHLEQHGGDKRFKKNQTCWMSNTNVTSSPLAESSSVFMPQSEQVARA